MNTSNHQELASLVRAFRPVYYFHTAERFYPCDFGDVLKHCSLWNRPDTKSVAEEVIPYPRLNSQAIHAEGIDLPERHRWALSWKPIDPAASSAAAKYKYVMPNTPGYFCKLHNQDILVGNLGGGTRTYFDPTERGGREKTSYENGFPFSPRFWLQQGHPGRMINANWSQETLRANRALTFSDNPQYCTISKRIFPNGRRYTDLIYTIFLAFNGSISIIPGAYSHLFDIEVVGVRFEGHDVSESSTPLRYYFAQHAGYSWYEPKNCEFMSVQDQIGVDKNQIRVDKKHLVVYLGRESHECYPKPGVWQRIYGLANDLCNQGVLWTPPARYINNPTDEEANQIRRYYKQHHQADIVLIPDAENGRGPEWWYSVTPGILPIHDPGKQNLREGAEGQTKASDHPPAEATNIDMAVPRRLDLDIPHDAVTTPTTPSAMGRQACERSFLAADRALSMELIDLIWKAITGKGGPIREKMILVDDYKKDWAGQSAGVDGIVGSDNLPIWYHKENIGAFDLRLWLHSGKSARKRHPGDDIDQYPGGIILHGLDHLACTVSYEEPESFKLKVLLPKGQVISATANVEVETKENKGGHMFTPTCKGHALLKMIVDELDIEISCQMKMPVAVTDRQLIMYSTDKDGSCTGPAAAGWFVPNVQYAHKHKDKFMGISEDAAEGAYGLPLDAVATEEEFATVLSFKPKIDSLKYRLDVSAHYIDLNKSSKFSIIDVDKFLRGSSKEASEALADVINVYLNATCEGFWGGFWSDIATLIAGLAPLIASIIEDCFKLRIRTQAPLDVEVLSKKLEGFVNNLFSHGFNP